MAADWKTNAEKIKAAALAAGISILFLPLCIAIQTLGRNVTDIESVSIWSLLLLISILVAVRQSMWSSLAFWCGIELILWVGSITPWFKDLEGNIALVLGFIAGMFLKSNKVFALVMLGSSVAISVICNLQVWGSLLAFAIGLLVVLTVVRASQELSGPILKLEPRSLRLVLSFAASFIIVGIYFAVCSYIGYEIDPRGSFVGNTAQSDVEFLDHLYFSFVTLFSGEILPAMTPSNGIMKSIYVIESGVTNILVAVYLGLLLMRVKFEDN